MSLESHNQGQRLQSEKQAASRKASKTATTSFREPNVHDLELDLEGLMDNEHTDPDEHRSSTSPASYNGSENDPSQASFHETGGRDPIDDSEYDFYASTKHIAHVYRALKAIQPAAKVYEGGQGVSGNSYARSMGTGRGNPFTTQSTQRHRKPGDTTQTPGMAGFDLDHDSDGDLSHGAHFATEEEEALARMVSKDVPVTVMIDENGLAFNMGRIHMGIARVYLERALFATYRKSDPDALYTFALPMHRLLQCLKILAASETAASRSGTTRQGGGGGGGGYDDSENDEFTGENSTRRRNPQRPGRARGEDENLRSNMICRIKYKATGDETFVLVFEDGQNMAIKCEFPVLTVDPYSETLPLGSDEEDEINDEYDDEEDEEEDDEEYEEDEEEEVEKEKDLNVSQISDSEEEEEEDNDLFFGRKKDDEKELRKQEREQAREERRKVLREQRRELRKEQRREQRRLEHQTGRVMGLDISNLRFKVLFRGKILAQKLHEMIVLQTSRLQIRASNEAPRLTFVSKAEMSDSAQYFPEEDAFPGIERFYLWTQTEPVRDKSQRTEQEEDEDEEQALDEDVATFWYDFRQLTMAIEGISIGETQNIRCDWNGFMGIQSKYVVDREQRIYIFFDFRFSALHD
ncbi:uncharacterized protein SAPINGB_P003995 [Magnusiomyces paraingens]|uniref:Uncharacterized protein n=1 Tax=Magnusiomyces paraingens TaxID=2606893 RepID=A0A5E8BXN3_9ASCO|nr:uncharacterized protein SAPINGB_P003995 [Saprochaete ingens]VVT54277.1 unnamed protein product [Saprochaete ingens]